MKTAPVILLPLLLGLAMPALAQEQNGAGKGGSGDMSYEDYLIKRAKMLLRMGGATPQGAPAPKPEAPAKRDGHDSTYGQGYGSRKNSRDGAGKPGVEHHRPERPERPQIERPQIEHPGRP